jgi:hypothetical protein
MSRAWCRRLYREWPPKRMVRRVKPHRSMTWAKTLADALAVRFAGRISSAAVDQAAVAEATPEPPANVQRDALAPGVLETTRQIQDQQRC